MTPDRITTDARGRKLLVHDLDPADQLDLFEACAKNSTNHAWVSLALLVCSVREIDGRPVPMPRNPEGVKNLARELGGDGIDAVGKLLSGGEGGAGLDVDTAKN